MAGKKPVIALCTNCLEPFTTEVSMQRHSSEQGHHRYAYTCETRETMTRTEAVGQAEMLLAEANREHRNGGTDLPLGLAKVQIASAYIELAKLCDD